MPGLSSRLCWWLTNKVCAAQMLINPYRNSLWDNSSNTIYSTYNIHILCSSHNPDTLDLWVGKFPFLKRKQPYLLRPMLLNPEPPSFVFLFSWDQYRLQFQAVVLRV